MKNTNHKTRRVSSSNYHPSGGKILLSYRLSESSSATADNPLSLTKTQHRSQINFTERTLTKAGNCFVAGAEIWTVDGIKNIENIRVGDWVIADESTTPGGLKRGRFWIRLCGKLMRCLICMWVGR